MFNLITPNEQKFITQYITAFGPLTESCDKPMASLETILSTWTKEKTTLFKLLDNQLIVRRPYTYTVPSENLIDEIISDKLNPAYMGFQSWWSYNIILGFTHTYPELSQLASDLISADMLAENRYYKDTKVFTFPDGETYKVSKGMRPMRIITKIAQKYNCDTQLLENFRLWHSRMLNQKYIDGELCLSIHPLDFMTMSDNDNNWSSCMSWMDVGEYRCGTIECMNSPVLLIAYLHNPNHTMKRPSVFLGEDWEWNSKRWRELFIVQNGIISEVKGYCFQDETLTNTSLMWIKELAQKNLNWEYDNDEININSIIPWEDNTDMCFHFICGQYMYNDIGTLDTHRARINRQKLGKYELTEWTTRDDKQHYMAEVDFGGQATCMWCGRDITEEDKDNAVMCEQCDGGKFCAYCGELINDGNYYYVNDIESPICMQCYYNECAEDAFTGEYYSLSSLTPIYWLTEFDENNEPVFHDICFYMYDLNERDYNKVFARPPKIYKDNWGCEYHYVTLDDVIDMDVFINLYELVESPI